MRQTSIAITGVLLVLALTLAGCGSGSATAGAGSSTTVQTIDFRSPAIDGPPIPSRYTCDGKDTPPPLEWGAVPADAATLTLFVVGFKPEPSTKTYAVSVEWAVAGLNPALHRLAPGRLPRGAFVGLSTDGKRRYSICPAKGTAERYQFEVYGLPASASVARNFSGLPVLSKLAISSGSGLANSHGAFIGTYKRR
jgi:phosphatidylethanolamine-binding protein (PEBP) family uncharacterized protein